MNENLKNHLQEEELAIPDYSFNWENVMPTTVAPELLKAEFVQAHLVTESPWTAKLYRVDQGDDRWYMYTDEHTGDLRYLMSVTTFCDKSLPMAYNLMTYLLENAKEATDLHKFWTAEYGTFFHIEAGEFLTEGTYQFGADSMVAKRKLAAYLLDKKIPTKLFWFWIRKFQKDMACLMQFVKDKNVKVLGVEFPCMSYKWDIAGSIDLICEMDFNGKRVNAIVDFKTGNHLNKDSHALQLHIYKALWNEHFEEIAPVTHVFNLRPKDFTVKASGEFTPSYELLNQSTTPVDWHGRLMTALNEGLFERTPRLQFLMTGDVTLGDEPKNNAEVLSYKDLYNQIKDEKNESTKK